MKNSRLCLMLMLGAFAVSPLLFAADEDQTAAPAENAQREELGAKRGVPAPLRPVTGVASGATGVARGTKEFLQETVEETAKRPSLAGTLEGAVSGSQAVVDSAVKGAYKIATLGYSDNPSYEVESPGAPTDYVSQSRQKDPTKFRIKIPGT